MQATHTPLDFVKMHPGKSSEISHGNYYLYGKRYWEIYSRHVYLMLYYLEMNKYISNRHSKYNKWEHQKADICIWAERLKRES